MLPDPDDIAAAGAPEPIALYLHWPFCLAKCPYCDFNSHVRERIPAGRFVAALRRELRHEAARIGRRPLASIFFGGGTPSLMPPEGVAALIADARGLFEPRPDLEITLEANPTSVETGRLRAFREAGVNRVSMGIQSLDDDALRRLGREHSAADAVRALEQARAIFPRLSFDLIYARPGQTLAGWRAELDRALALAADHLSLYQLTVEPGTRFEAEHRAGRLLLPPDELGAALYTETAAVAARHGLEAYEVSNYARPGAESRHNLAYWRYGDYAGIGPGAHGRLSLADADGIRRLFATRRHRAPEPWAERVERDGTGLRSQERLDAPDPAREMLLMGLRLREGIDSRRFRARTGTALLDAVDPAMLEACLEEGYLRWQPRSGASAGGGLVGGGPALGRNDWHDHCLAATDEGRLRLDALLPVLVR
ncbi:radical SAM family heme chaperone HemW [Rhizosaccharibacter radicis]|uniref:Heme chaperone HemW n=1 Tax=Rhizosaccharibacter radicis TaxID=2782605 RepID=A0ABT1VUA3_9PROT|nr:radical SAM family heme chaperone HemW [Acetobacteraceae bacterium KSS12]